MNGAVFAGLVILGDISYPDVTMIVQDPNFTQDALADIGYKTTLRFLVGLLMIGGSS